MIEMETLGCERCGKQMTAEMRLASLAPGRASVVFFLCVCGHADKKNCMESQDKTSLFEGLPRRFLVWATKGRNLRAGRFAK
jgi:hypothetical protein